MENIAKKIAPILLFMVLSITVFFVNTPIVGPTIQADEGSYLLTAAAFAGYPNDFAGSYHSGYSIFIVPAFWLADTPKGIWLLKTAINSICYFLTIIGLWLLATKIAPKNTLRQKIISVVLVSLYPAWVVLVGYSFAQSAFVPVYLFMFIAYFEAVRRGGWRWVVVGVLAGLLYWIHPTGFVPIIAVSSGAIYLSISQRRYNSFVILVLTTMGMVLIYRYGITPGVVEKMSTSELSPHLHYPSVFKLLSPLTTFEGLKEVVARIAGQFFYLTIGTVGLFWLGLWAFLKNSIIPRHNSEHRELSVHGRSLVIFVAVTLAGMILLPVLMFSSTASSQRLDHWMYGRYVEGVIAPILLAGALSVSFRKLYWTVPIAVLCVLFLTLGLESYIHTARFNVPAFWQEFYLREQGVWSWMAAGCVLIIITAAIPHRIGMLLVAVVFIFSSYLQINWHVAASKNASARWDAALKVRESFSTSTCIGFDYSGLDSYNKQVFWFDFGFILFDYKLKRIGFEQWLNTCDGPIFTYKDDLDKQSGIYQIAKSRYGGPTAWMKGYISNNLDYPLLVSKRSPALLSILGSGWHDIESSYVWSDSNASLHLPVPEQCRYSSCSVVLSFFVYGASEERPVEVLFGADSGDNPKLLPVVAHSSSIQKMLVPLDSQRRIVDLSVTIPEAISPYLKYGDDDRRVLGIALNSIELLIESESLFWSGRSHVDSQVGIHTSKGMQTDSQDGYLIYGPYKSISSGEYILQITGKVRSNGDHVVVDVVDHKTGKTFAYFEGVGAEKGSEDTVILEEKIVINDNVDTLEIRVYVSSVVGLLVSGYSLQSVN